MVNEDLRLSAADLTDLLRLFAAERPAWDFARFFVAWAARLARSAIEEAFRFPFTAFDFSTLDFTSMAFLDARALDGVFLFAPCLRALEEGGFWVDRLGAGLVRAADLAVLGLDFVDLSDFLRAAIVNSPHTTHSDAVLISRAGDIQFEC